MKSAREQLLRGGVSSVFIKLANIFFLFAITTALARACGVYNFGVYSYVYAIIQILSILAQLGFQVLAVREVAAYQATGKWGLLKGFIRQANIMVLVVSGVLVGMGLLVSWIFSGHYSSAQMNTFILGLALFPLIALGNLRGSILRGFQKIVQGQLPEMVLRPGIFLLLVGGYWWAAKTHQLSPEFAMGLHVGAGLVAFLFGVVMLKRQLPRELKPVVREYETQRWVKSALLLSLITSMQIINSQTDVIMLGAMVGPREAGLYRVAVQSAILVVFGLSVVNMVVSPYFARYFAREEMDRLQSLATTCARVSLAFALPVFLVFYFFGGWILGTIFGAEFSAGHTSLRILAGGQLFSAAMGSVVILLSMTGHEFSLAKGLVVTAGLNIAVNFLLIPLWGMEGAAVATTLTMLFWNFVLARAVKTQLDISSWAFKF